MKPKISIIVPIYNAEKYLNKCINSILNQTFKEFELILINDGSTDNSKEICEMYLQLDSRIKIINQKNQGQSDARNKGLKIAQGKYIGFVDSDDWIEEYMYQKLIDSCILNNSDMSIIGMREIDLNGTCLQNYRPNNNISFSEIIKRAYPVNKLFKKELFTINNFYFKNGKYYEDLELIPKIYTKCNKISIVNKIAYNYLKRPGSTTSTQDEKILDNLWAYIEIQKYLCDQDMFKIYQEEFDKSINYFKKYYINILYEYPYNFFKKNYKDIITDFKQLGGIKKKEYLLFLGKLIIFNLKRLTSLSLKKVRMFHK